MNAPPFPGRNRRGPVQVPTVTLAHGGGGKAMKDLIDDVFVRAFDNPRLAPLEDQARVDLAEFTARGDRLAFTTDSFVVDPLVFPGGDIGKLAVCGTVNDLAVGGAEPLYLSCAVVIEEGVGLDLLRRIAGSMADAAREAGVEIVTGDTKVVPKGACDKLFITTTGIGAIRRGLDLAAGRARAGDAVLVNGVLGDHGAAILCARGDMALESPIESDCAALHGLIGRLIAAAPNLRCLRDPTRGGAATVLNEIAEASGLQIEIDESETPLREEVKAFCEILGLDPLYLANEGKIVAVVPAARGRRRAGGDEGASARPRGADHRPGRRRRGGARHHADRLRRPAHRRHARRRAIAAHLLRPQMHELSLTRNIVEMVAAAADDKRVLRVTLEIGTLSGVMPDAIEFCFPAVAKGTALEGAVLEIRHIRARARCRHCGAEFDTAELLTPCACGSHDLARLQGEELNIRSMELEEAR